MSVRSPRVPRATRAAHRSVESHAAAEPDTLHQAWWLLRTGFAVLPIVFGLDKFFGVLTNWDAYLSSAFASLSPLSVHSTMDVVGVVEILAGMLVAWHPRIGAYVVAAWLAGIIVNLLVLTGHADVALRDVGLLVGALALQRLSVRFDDQPLALPALHR